jgi:hypothetical protein
MKTQTPLDWKSSPPPTNSRGLAAAFSGAWDAGVFTGRLNEAMSAETYLSLVTPFLPDEQSHHQAKITLTNAQYAHTSKEKSMRRHSAPLTAEQLERAAITREEKEVARLVSPEDVARLIVELLREYAIDIKGMEPYARDRFLQELKAEKLSTRWAIEWRRTFGVGCTLYVRLDSSDLRGGEKYRIQTFKPVVEVNWGGTGRSVAASLASIELYREVTALAALIEARLAEVHSIGTASLLTEG